VIRTVSAAIQTTPHLGQIKQIAHISRTGIETLLSVEQIPGVHQLPFVTIRKERKEAEESAEAAS